MDKATESVIAAVAVATAAAAMAAAVLVLTDGILLWKSLDSEQAWPALHKHVVVQSHNLACKHHKWMYMPVDKSARQLVECDFANIGSLGMEKTIPLSLRSKTRL